MRFSRWHAHGNVYLLAERDKVCGPLGPEAVRDLCSDADGIVEVVAVRGNEADVIVWNPDGSTAEMSGNGTRIAGRWLADLTGADEVRIRVGPREITARMLGGAEVETDMGEVEVREPEEIEGLRVVRVSVGNPHAVVEGDPDDLPRIGPLLETHTRFPNRTNVQVARQTASGDIVARVWERGVGETSASGTGAVAVAAAVGQNPARVQFPGGLLEVRFEGGRAFLTGAAERLAADSVLP